MVTIGNEWDDLLKDEFSKEYYQNLRKFLVDEYNHYEPKHKARVSMAPGLTGLWQVSGRSDIKNFDEVVKLDMEYINNWSVFLDLKIILLTIKVVLFGKGAK